MNEKIPLWERALLAIIFAAAFVAVLDVAGVNPWQPW